MTKVISSISLLLAIFPAALISVTHCRLPMCQLHETVCHSFVQVTTLS